jgi:hypothetical protein
VAGDGPPRPTVAMMPKVVGDPYFVSARGRREAARELASI